MNLRCTAYLRFTVFTVLLPLLCGCIREQANKHTSWSQYLGDNAVSHYSALHQIDTTNVRHLTMAWQYHTGDADSSGHSQMECNPIIVNGILYATSPKLKLIALDAASGKEKWVFDPYASADKASIQINASRGVTYWEEGRDKRIFFAAGSYVYAVNAQTGTLVTAFGDSGRIDLHDGLDRDVQDLYVVSTTPGIIYKNLLILGTRVSEGGDAAPGNIRAFDVRTGKRAWIFHTIPHPGEPGYDTWENKDAWKYTGGANCWSGMSLDEKRGIVYAPTGSATFDFYGGLRKGRNLFSNCILALDAGTGKLLWHFQTIHHDLWDRDLPAPPNLVTIMHKGKKTDALAQVTKTGFVFVLNRDDGTPLYPVHEVPVPDSSTLTGESPWPTQPVPELPRPFMPQTFDTSDINNLVPPSSQQAVRSALARLEYGHMLIPPSEKGSVVFPGFDGGAEWGGASYDPETGYLYINTNQVPWTLHMVKAGEDRPEPARTASEYGHRIYTDHCMACHGTNREGGGDYPSLLHIGQKYSEAEILRIINNGRRMMPAFKQIPDREKKYLIAYLLGIKGDTPLKKGSSGKNTGGLSKSPFVPYNMTGYNKLVTPEGYPANKPPWGTLTAINLNTGRQVWQIPLGSHPELEKNGMPATGTENYGGAAVTSGGLLFIAATSDGKIRAFNKATGKLLWEAGLPAPGYATPSTYAVNGKQYLVIACGGGKLNSPSGDVYMAFALP
ncbi:PQQ-binding-like beta-propeller repeat protein [Compostibacter hankyongensis]|uniref:Cytochrome c domain-containing protein n=1 Tax=Compostibacter hankyongensis TaxID=1007089 RepID=A0ABP8G1T0_9BACT